MSYPVYRLHTIPSSTNAYTTGRMETWTLKLDSTYTNEADARIAVIAGNRKHSELARFLPGMSTDEEDDFIERFCFGPTHLHLRRVFFGLPDKKAIIAAIESQGDTVVQRIT